MNRYVEEAMKAQQDHLPKTFEEYAKMHPANANRVPIAHVHKLREERDSASTKTQSDFVARKITWE